MKIYILGICGTFMAGLALLARELGHQVSGSDARVYPPMSTQLADAGIELREGYTRENLDLDADLFVVGNAMSRGNPQVEAILELGLRYTSGPQWLHDHLLSDRWVLAVAGTHGKTTTSSMIAWILEYAGMKPGFLIGGLTRNFNASARLGSEPFFVIEADEYDTAFFDKRSKFVHYAPRSLVLNNLEFDHADIFDDLDAIKRQFHHLMRIVPANGLVVTNRMDPNLDAVLEMGCWTPTQGFADTANNNEADLVIATHSIVEPGSQRQWPLENLPAGHFNHLNACAAALAARHAGVPMDVAFDALRQFAGVKRRQEVVAEIGAIRVIDDFAHHPTAISGTLQALRGSTAGRLFAVIEPRSNTMKAGVHRDQLASAFDAADQVVIYDNGDLAWDPHALMAADPDRVTCQTNVEAIVDLLIEQCCREDTIVLMSNGGFDGLQDRLLARLTARYDA